MSIEKIKNRGEEFRQSFKCCDSITAPKKTKKDNSSKGDIFQNCRCCGEYIRGDFRSNFDGRYCQDCL